MGCNKDCKELEIAKNMSAEILARFCEDCYVIARQNWTYLQVEMLMRLFEAAGKGYEYKCIGCKYFFRFPDEPDTNPEECKWAPGEWEDDYEVKPCEEGDE